MLDDLKMIHHRDAQDALGMIGRQAEQLREQYEVAAVDTTAISNVVYAGMGDAALAADMTLVWPGYRLPFEVIRNYTVPSYVSDTTLFIAASYSGDDPETLSALVGAGERGATIVVITSGGKLMQLADKNDYVLVRLTASQLARYSLPSIYKAVLDVVQKLNIFAVIPAGAGLSEAKITHPTAELDSTIQIINNSVASWRADVPTTRNQSKQIAQELMGRSVIIYSGQLLSSAAYAWKTSLNQNAKQLAWTGQLPEYQYNEAISWTKQPIDKPYAVIELQSDLEHPAITQAFLVNQRLLSGMRPLPITIQAVGKTILEQLVSTIVLGEYVSIYLALLNGVNPTPVDLIAKFNKEICS